MDRKKFQKKKAKKAAKSKTKKAEYEKQRAIRGTGGSLALRAAFQAPLYQCWEPGELFDRNRGIGSVVVTRKTPHHKIVMAVFLLDVFCLGVKNAHVDLVSDSAYQSTLQRIRTHERLQSISPECARKLVEDAEAYAQALGFAPHKDYHAAKGIFGDIEPTECSRCFEFGRDGKPLYIAGPHDKRAFRKSVMQTLTDKLGPEGFHYVMPLDDPPESLLS